MDFIEKTIATEKRLRTITWVAVCSVVALVVFAGATFGLTYAVVDMTKEAQAAVCCSSTKQPALMHNVTRTLHNTSRQA